jgi:hypothetical protein
MYKACTRFAPTMSKAYSMSIPKILGISFNISSRLKIPKILGIDKIFK